MCFSLTAGSRWRKCERRSHLLPVSVCSYLIQAIAMVARGDASIQDIDTGMKLGAGHPMGPLQLADYVGNDVCLAVMDGWTAKYPENPAFKVSPDAFFNLFRGSILSHPGFWCLSVIVLQCTVPHMCTSICTARRLSVGTRGRGAAGNDGWERTPWSQDRSGILPLGR